MQNVQTFTHRAFSGKFLKGTSPFYLEGLGYYDDILRDKPCNLPEIM
jgi:hypothetical protein